MAVGAQGDTPEFRFSAGLRKPAAAHQLINLLVGFVAVYVMKINDCGVLYSAMRTNLLSLKLPPRCALARPVRFGSSLMGLFVLLIPLARIFTPSFVCFIRHSCTLKEKGATEAAPST
tara:strand:- start:4071 stop:4424 length:354 start_codon:yes stop_codon:yes gene_type:complete